MQLREYDEVVRHSLPGDVYLYYDDDPDVGDGGAVMMIQTRIGRQYYEGHTIFDTEDEDTGEERPIDRIRSIRGSGHGMLLRRPVQ